MNIGVDLRDANITRLRWELSEIFEKDLLSDEEEHENINNFEVGDIDEILADEFMEIANEINERGYKFVPSVRKLIDKYEEEKQKNIKNAETLAELEKEIDKFGRRRQKYLRRVTRKID